MYDRALSERIQIRPTHLKLYGGLLAVWTKGSYGILFGCCFCFGEGDEDDELATDDPDEYDLIFGVARSIIFCVKSYS